jgi:hypothetical protein
MVVFLGLHKSDKPDKKYYAEFETESGRTARTYFGSAGMMDYTKHPAGIREQRKAAYDARHKPTENWSDPMSAGALAKYILWNRPTIRAALADYKRRFGFTGS